MGLFVLLRGRIFVLCEASMLGMSRAGFAEWNVNGHITWDDTKFIAHVIVVAVASSSSVWHVASFPSQLRTCSETHSLTSPRTRSSRNESMQIDIAFTTLTLLRTIQCRTPTTGASRWSQQMAAVQVQVQVRVLLVAVEEVGPSPSASRAGR